MADVVIEAKSLEKVYDTGKVKVHALRGIDLKIRKGEMVAVMGPSGCGKTTLLNCLSGLDDPTAGNVYLEGSDLGTMKDDAKTLYRAKRMGFVFQFYNLLPVLTAIENVELPLLVSGVRLKEAKQRAEDALGKVGLKEWAHHKPAELSGGQRQRVTIARSLVNDPAIVFGDEPTGDLDTDTSGQVMDLMVDLNKEKEQTFIIVTHDPKIGERCGRMLKMKDGKIVEDTGGDIADDDEETEEEGGWEKTDEEEDKDD